MARDDQQEIEVHAGEIIDNLDALFINVDDPSALSHLYVARRVLLRYLEVRPDHASAAAHASLCAVEDACERAIEKKSDPNSLTNDIREIRDQVAKLRAATRDRDVVPLGKKTSHRRVYEQERWESRD